MRACLSVCLRLIRSTIHANEPCGCVCFAFFCLFSTFCCCIVVVSQEVIARERGGGEKERGRGRESEQEESTKKCQPGIMCGVVKWKRNCN